MKLFHSALLRSPLFELVEVASGSILFFAIAAHVELSERVAHWVRPYENWQLDELPLTLVILSTGLAWFSVRRWRELRREMAARRLVEQSNQLMLSENQQLARRLVELREAERASLARELHDEFGQCCVAIRVDAATIARETRGPQSAAYESACAIMANADHLHDVVRTMLHQLRPASLEFGLIDSLRLLIDGWRKRHNIACSFSALGKPFELDESANIALYRTVQESLTNIARHARATHAGVALAWPEPGSKPLTATTAVMLTIQDDGAGFNPEPGASGLGIAGMKERIRALGGTLRVAQSASGGTLVQAWVPQAATATEPA